MEGLGAWFESHLFHSADVKLFLMDDQLKNESVLIPVFQNWLENNWRELVDHPLGFGVEILAVTVAIYLFSCLVFHQSDVMIMANNRLLDIQNPLRFICLELN